MITVPVDLMNKILELQFKFKLKTIIFAYEGTKCYNFFKFVAKC